MPPGDRPSRFRVISNHCPTSTDSPRHRRHHAGYGSLFTGVIVLGLMGHHNDNHKNIPTGILIL
jgi:hypothetical protein